MVYGRANSGGCLAFLDERCAPVLHDGDRPGARAFGRNREESLTVRHRVHPYDVGGQSRKRLRRSDARRPHAR